MSWTCRTSNAPWEGRYLHTSVIDAAGAIYVIGGRGSSDDFNDVWRSTDGGVRPDSRRCSGGAQGILGGTKGVLSVSTGVLQGYLQGTVRVI